MTALLIIVLLVMMAGATWYAASTYSYEKKRTEMEKWVSLSRTISKAEKNIGEEINDFQNTLSDMRLLINKAQQGEELSEKEMLKLRFKAAD